MRHRQAEFLNRGTRQPSCGMILLRWLSSALALVGCTPKAHDASSAPSLVGTWIRVFPPAGALDTLSLGADGSLSGSVAGLDSLGFNFSQWRIGDRLSPEAFCVGDGKQTLCQGYRLSADTFALANGKHTVFVRLPADGHVVTAWGEAASIGSTRHPVDSVQALKPTISR